MLASVPVTFWSKSKSKIALSSGEAELNSSVKAISETLGFNQFVGIPFPPKPIRTISGFLELISRFALEFRRCGFFFERFEFLVCSKFNHTPCGCPCACAVACLHPRNSNSNVVVSVTIHDNSKIYIYTRDVARSHCGRS